MAESAVIGVLRDSNKRGSWAELAWSRTIGLQFPIMAKSSSEPFEVSCPCCTAVLKVDPSTRAVISHVAPIKPKTFSDFEAAAKAMRDNEGRKESIFRQAVDAEKNKADLLEKKFQEAIKKAKEAPDEPRIRDFDLD